MKRLRDRGAVMMESAIILPLLLMLAIGLSEGNPVHLVPSR